MHGKNEVRLYIDALMNALTLPQKIAVLITIPWTIMHQSFEFYH